MQSGSAVPVKAVVFDLDGTLVDTMQVAPAVYVDVVAELGGPELSVADVVDVWHIGPTRVLLEHFLDRPVTADDLEVYFGRIESAFARLTPFEGVAELIADLRHLGIGTGVFTTATRRSASLMLAAAGLDRSLTVLVCGDEVARPKPAPDGLQLACRQLDCPPAKAAYVGDAPTDMQCAAAAGALGILAAWGGVGHEADDAPLTAARPVDVLTLIGESHDGEAGSH